MLKDNLPMLLCNSTLF